MRRFSYDFFQDNGRLDVGRWMSNAWTVSRLQRGLAECNAPLPRQSPSRPTVDLRNLSLCSNNNISWPICHIADRDRDLLYIWKNWKYLFLAIRTKKFFSWTPKCKNIKTFLRLPTTMSEHWTKSRRGPFQLIMCPPWGGAGGGRGAGGGGREGGWAADWANNSINCVNCPIVSALLAGAGQVVPVTSTVNTDNYHQQEQCLAWSSIVFNIHRLFRIEVKLFGGVLDTFRYIWRLENRSLNT